jgi:hypothetical protein
MVLQVVHEGEIVVSGIKESVKRSGVGTSHARHHADHSVGIGSPRLLLQTRPGRLQVSDTQRRRRRGNDEPGGGLFTTLQAVLHKTNV